MYSLKKQVYIFSGLGADERVFDKLDFAGLSVTFVKWITPLKNDTIEQYATKLLSQITKPNPTLIGLSFGGMMAVEVAKQIETEKVVLIASAKTKHEVPFYYRFAGYIGLHKLLSAGLLKSSNVFTNWFFGLTESWEKQLLKQILKDTNPVFLKWAVDKVACWSNKTVLDNIFHIHGSSDKVLPLAFVKCNAVIDKGGHLMTLNKVEQLNKIIRQQIL